MKIRMMLLMFCVMAITPAVFAQSTINLFDATPVTVSSSMFPKGGPYNFNDAITYDSASVFCPVGGTGTLTGPDGGSLIVDNFLTVNGTNVCGPGIDSQANCFTSATVTDADAGQAVDTYYTGVSPINITNLLASGGSFTFNLRDYGGQFGNTAINLTNTNCTLVTEEGTVAVCHRNNRNKNGKRTKTGDTKTIFVDTSDVNGHLSHGDTLGPCEGDTGGATE